MANIKSQIKRNRTEREGRERNKAVRSELKTRTSGRRDGRRRGGEDVDRGVKAARSSRIDKAATKGVIHKNTAARRKSRLAKKASPQSET